MSVSKQESAFKREHSHVYCVKSCNFKTYLLVHTYKNATLQLLIATEKCGSYPQYRVTNKVTLSPTLFQPQGHSLDINITEKFITK